MQRHEPVADAYSCVYCNQNASSESCTRFAHGKGRLRLHLKHLALEMAAGSTIYAASIKDLAQVVPNIKYNFAEQVVLCLFEYAVFNPTQWSCTHA